MTQGQGARPAALAWRLALLAPFAVAAGRQLRSIGVHPAGEAKASSKAAAAPAARTASSGSAAATQYYGLVQVGHPAQEFRVVFDTASGQFILPGLDCEDAACVKHRRFAPQNSSSAQQIGWADEPTRAIDAGEDRDTKSFSFLGADVSGEFMRDTVCVGGASGKCGVVDFVALTEESDQPFSELGFDGVVGLSPSSPDAKEFNVLHALLASAPPKQRLFGLHLTPTGGELLFGAYRQSHLDSELTWTPTLGKDGWQVRLSDVAVGGKEQGICGKSGCEAAIDTGASLIMMPGHMLWSIMEKLGVDDNCSGDLPSLAFVVGGRQLTLDAQDYMERDGDGCRLLLASTTGGSKGPALVLGYPFLRKHYTVFDMEGSRIGFAVAKHSAAAAAEVAPAGSVAVQLVGLTP